MMEVKSKQSCFDGIDKKMMKVRNHLRLGGIVDQTVVDF